MIKKTFAIYSCYYGCDNAITFKQPRYNCCDTFFFTNNYAAAILAEKNGWFVIFDNEPVYEDYVLSTMQGKKVKCLPHNYNELSKYEYLIWVDDKTMIDPLLVLNNGLNALEADGSLSVRLHPQSYKNIWAEYGISLLQARYRNEKYKMWEYIHDKISQGFSEEGNLFWNNVIIRNMRHNEVNTIGERWLSEISVCGIQDQISFFFIAQEFLSIRIQPKNVVNTNTKDLLKNFIFDQLLNRK